MGTPTLPSGTDDSDDDLFDDNEDEEEEEDGEAKKAAPAAEDRTGQVVSRILDKLERDAVARRNLGRALATAPPLLERYLALTHMQGPTTLDKAARELGVTPTEVKGVVIAFLSAAEDVLEEE